MPRIFFLLLFFLILSGWAPTYAQDSISPVSQSVAAPTPQDVRVNTLERDIRTVLFYLKPLDYLPIKLSIEQFTSYNDNVQLVPNNVPLLPGLYRSDLLSSTNLNGALRFPIGSQRFFVSGGYGLQRYLRNKQLDSDAYHIEGGLDWSLGKRCTGDAVGAYATYQAPFIQQDAPGQINLITTLSATASARCHIAGHVYGVANGGWRQYSNSLVTFQTNNRNQTFETVGFEYDGSPLDRVGATATFVQRSFTTRSLESESALAQGINQQNYLFNYARLITPNISVSGSAGVAAVQAIYTNSQGTADFPIYTVDFSWRLTPKISFGFDAYRLITAPQGTVSNAQSSEGQSLRLGYRYSPRLMFNALVSRTNYNNQPLGGFTGVNVGFQNQRVLMASLLTTYTFSPLLTLTGAYTYTDRFDLMNGLRATANQFMFGISYHGNGFYTSGGTATSID